MSDTEGKPDPGFKPDAKLEEVRANDLDMQVLAQDFLKNYKKKRASAKGSITKIIKSLKKSIYFGGSKDQVTHEMNKLQESYKSYKLLNASLDKHFDEKNPAHSNVYRDATVHSDKVSKEVFEIADIATKYVKSVPCTDEASSGNMTLEQVKEIITSLSPAKPMEALIKSINLPRQEDVKFNGDPSQYHTFLRNFECRWASWSEDKILLLQNLIAQCTGVAHTAIKDCILLGEPGYDRALTILEERFGNSFLVTQKIVNSLRYGKCVRTASEVSML